MKRLKNEQGMAMVLVLLIMVVGVVLITAMLMMSRSENEQAIDQTENMKAYYIARAGADTMILRIKNLPDLYWGSFTTPLTTTSTVYGDGSFVASVQRTGDYFTVTSTGTYRDTQQQVQAVLKYYNNTDMKYAVYSAKPMTEVSMKDLSGILGSGGSIGIKPGDESRLRPYTDPGVTMSKSIPKPVLTGFSTTPVAFNLNTNASSFYNSIDVKNKDTWSIDTSKAEFNVADWGNPVLTDAGGSGKGNCMVVQVNNMNEIKGTLEVKGGKTLIFIVNGPLTISKDVVIKDNSQVKIFVNDTTTSDPDAYDLIISSSIKNIGSDKKVSGIYTELDLLNIYLNPSVRLNVLQNPKLYGYIIGPEAYVNLANGSSEIYGSIFADKVDIGSSASVFFQKPDNNTIYLKTIQFAYWK